MMQRPGISNYVFISLFIIFLGLMFLACGGGGGSTPPPGQSSQPPVVTTNAPSAVNSSSANLNAGINPNGMAATAWFEWNTNPNLSGQVNRTQDQQIGSDLTVHSVSASLTGLSSGTTYYYRAMARNGAGSRNGSIMSFTTSAPSGPPVISNLHVELGSDWARLNAWIQPNGQYTEYFFEWGTDPGLVGAERTDQSGIGATNGIIPMGYTISNVPKSTKYYYRVVAWNSSGTTVSEIADFTTFGDPIPPTVHTLNATNITPTTATLNGTVNPNGDPNSSGGVWFEWGTDPTLTQNQSSLQQSFPVGNANIPFSDNLTWLTPVTTYYYRIVAFHGELRNLGQIVSFTTAQSGPSVQTGNATSVTATSAVLNARVNPNGSDTRIYFSWGTAQNNLANKTLEQSIGSGTADNIVSVPLSGLVASTTYYYTVVATNIAGSNQGSVGSFTTLPSGQPPTIQAVAPTLIYSDNVTIHGSANPNGLASNVYVEWSTDAQMAGASRTSDLVIGTGTTLVDFDILITSLTPSTLYYYRVVGVNTAGTTRGAIMSFATLPTISVPPTVDSLWSRLITENSASLEGTVNTNGMATNAYFEWGTSPTLVGANKTPDQALGMGTGTNMIQASLSGLAASTTYYWRVVATNAAGSSYSSIKYFTTTASSVSKWGNSGLMTTERGHHTATLLSNGKVLVAGGWGLSAGTFSAELYDPSTGGWSKTGDMTTTRYGHTATRLDNGKVLVVCGWWHSSAELYDPTLGIWAATGPMASPTIRGAWPTATLLPNGKVLVTGGNSGSGSVSSAELYDPNTGTWSLTNPMTEPRYAHTATLLSNGKVLVVGGWGRGGIVRSTELYDITTETWSLTNPVIVARDSHTDTRLSNGKVLIAGGYTAGGDAELYDPTTGTWLSTNPMAEAREDHTATQLLNGKVLIAGGWVGAGGTSSSELYDPITGTWSGAGLMSVSRYSHTATPLPDGRVLVTGGIDSGNKGISSYEIYTP